jgi:hypothetical protein
MLSIFQLALGIPSTTTCNSLLSLINADQDLYLTIKTQNSAMASLKVHHRQHYQPAAMIILLNGSLGLIIEKNFLKNHSITNRYN